MNKVLKIFGLATLMMAAGCKGTLDPLPADGIVRFEVSVPTTKAELINTEEQFRSKEGFSVISYVDAETSRTMNKVAVSYNTGTGAWTYSGEYLWKKDVQMRFFAYYPASLASSLDSKTSEAGIAAFTYSPLTAGSADVKGQTDYMLATYKGAGVEGVASLSFSHALSSVQFKFGENIDAGVTAITGVAIGGFYTQGTCSPSFGDTDVTCVWSGQSGAANDSALSQTGFSADPTATDKSIGAPFILVPGQTFTDAKPMSVILTATIGGKTGQTLIASVTSGTLEPGKTTTYTINYTVAGGVRFGNPVVTDWDENGESGTPVLQKDFGMLPSVFTINASGDKVYFSKGNLQFRATADGSCTDLTHKTADGTKPGIWRFAQEQWHTVGDGGEHIGNVYETIEGVSTLCSNMVGFLDAGSSGVNINRRKSYTGWIDMFADAASGYAIDPWECRGSITYGPDRGVLMGDDISGTNYDAGVYNAISNGGNVPGFWRLLTNDEWVYLLETRQSPQMRIDESLQYVNNILVAVGETIGMMIFPDGFVWPDSIPLPEYYELKNFAGFYGLLSASYYLSSPVTLEQFGELEKMGAVFLPECFGYKIGSASEMTIVYGPRTVHTNESGEITVVCAGKYQSSVIAHGFVPISPAFSESVKYWDASFIAYTGSVRLVHDAEED